METNTVYVTYTYPLLGIYTSKALSQHITQIPAYSCLLLAMSTIASLKTWPQCLPADKWIKKMWNICTMEINSAIKRSKFMPFVGKWIQLKFIAWSELGQIQKDKTSHFLLVLTCRILCWHIWHGSWRQTMGKRRGPKRASQRRWVRSKYMIYLKEIIYMKTSTVCNDYPPTEILKMPSMLPNE